MPGDLPVKRLFIQLDRIVLRSLVRAFWRDDSWIEKDFNGAGVWMQKSLEEEGAETIRLISGGLAGIYLLFASLATSVALTSIILG
jgi:hypothetical protein